jgi:hypothetical protein
MNVPLGTFMGKALLALERGGDFADGVIAFDGRIAGGQIFTSFDWNAFELISATGGETRLLSE